MKRLGIDLDGVVADFVGGFFKISNPMFGTDHHEQKSWDFEQYTNEQVDLVWTEIKKTRNFWTTLSPEKGVDRLLYSKPDVELVFITSRIPTIGASPREQSCSWLSGHFGITYPFVIVVDNPSEKIPLVKNLGIETFIDDKPSTVRQMHNAGIRTYVRSQLYNTQEIFPTGVISVPTLNDFLEAES